MEASGSSRLVICSQSACSPPSNRPVRRKCSGAPAYTGRPEILPRRVSKFPLAADGLKHILIPAQENSLSGYSSTIVSVTWKISRCSIWSWPLGTKRWPVAVPAQERAWIFHPLSQGFLLHRKIFADGVTQGQQLNRHREPSSSSQKNSVGPCPCARRSPSRTHTVFYIKSP